MKKAFLVSGLMIVFLALIPVFTWINYHGFTSPFKKDEVMEIEPTQELTETPVEQPPAAAPAPTSSPQPKNTPYLDPYQYSVGTPDVQYPQFNSPSYSPPASYTTPYNPTPPTQTYTSPRDTCHVAYGC